MQQDLSLIGNTVSISPFSHGKIVSASSLCGLLQGQLHAGQTLSTFLCHILSCMSKCPVKEVGTCGMES